MSDDQTMRTDDVLRAQLVGRREQVQALAVRLRADRQLDRLLDEIDSAIARMDAGTYGSCEVCHDPIEPDRLACNPLIQFCVDHMSSAERRALEDDLQLALHVQAKLLPPRAFSSAGWESCYEYLPAGPVGGDFCDVIPCGVNGQRLFFAIGDVSGKGVAASLLMSHLHAILRTLIVMDLPLAGLVEHANRLFCQATLSAHYATLVCGYAAANGSMELCNAGHCRPLLLRGRTVETVEPTALPAGLFAEARYDSCSFTLGEGDALLIYTDGVTEARNRLDDEYGAERLAAVLRNTAAAPVAGALEACIADLERFLDNAPKRDDVTVLMLRRAASAGLVTQSEEKHQGDREYRQHA